jgi:outer membrane receptor for ferric coprogen and ferric-rhodotorulic acid
MESGPWARAIGDENVRNDILPCRRLLALTMSAVLSGTAWSAQDDKDPDSPEAGSRAVQMQAVEVVGRRAQTSFSESSFAATKTETAVLDLPQSVSAVTKETIREQSLQRRTRSRRSSPEPTSSRSTTTSRSGVSAAPTTGA